MTNHPTDLSTRVMNALWQSGRAMRMNVAPMLEQEYGVDFKHFVLLKHLEHGCCYPSQLSQDMSLTASHVSRILEELSEKGLIIRQLDPKDSRKIQISITPSGITLLLAIRQHLKDILVLALANFENHEAEVITQGLERLTEALGNVSSHHKEPL